MSFYLAEWRQRAALTVDVTAAGPSVGCTVSLAGLPDKFWDAPGLHASGNDLRVTGPDGETSIPFNLSSFNKANRTGTVLVDDFTFGAAAMCSLWLYYDHTGSPSTGSTSVSPSVTRSSYFSKGPAPRDNLVAARREHLGRDQPTIQIQKMSGDLTYIWWDWSGVLIPRSQKHRGSVRLEEVAYVIPDTLNDAGSTQAAMKDVPATRILHPSLVRTTVKAGTTGNSYIASCQIGTSEGRILESRIVVRVKNTLP